MAQKKRVLGRVFVVPLAKDGSIMSPWPEIGHAYSESGAVKLARKEGYRVIGESAGGNIQYGYTPLPDGDGVDAYSVTVKGK